MSCAEEQQEEAEVLLSIYEGDQSFKQVSPTVYHYRYGEEDSPKAFVAEVVWTENYPNEVPKVNLDLFGNRHLLEEVRDGIRDKVIEQAELNTGMPMTYTLFEWLKENCEELTAAQPDRVQTVTEEVRQESNVVSESAPKEPKKEKLSKSQKRKLAGRVVNGELPRGHNWVDVVKHLLQSGSAG